jgi:hypothetical protein
MFLYCARRRSWRFLAAPSIFRSWFLGRLGMMGPEAKSATSQTCSLCVRPMGGVTMTQNLGGFLAQSHGMIAYVTLVNEKYPFCGFARRDDRRGESRVASGC